jgi:hypothetical protein
LAGGVLRPPARAARSPLQRARVTNDPYRLPGVDGRSPAGRRYRDIVYAIIAKFGDGDSESIRELAMLKLTLEATQAAAVSGDSKARTDIVRLLRMIEKKEAALRLAAAASIKLGSDDDV